MRNDQHLALKLRKGGASYGEISKKLDIPKSTLNAWFKNLDWSNEIKKTLTEKAIRTSRKRIKRVIATNRKKWEEWRSNLREEAKKEFKVFQFNSLFIAGVMLYWGEGDQNLKYPVRLTNVNDKMIVLFKKFLLEICKAKKEDIFLSLFIYPDINEEKCKQFWQEKIKVKQFDKVQVIYGKHPTKRLENGICSIRVKKSVGLKEKIVIWINLLSDELSNKARV